MKRLSPSWKTFFDSCSVLTVLVHRNTVGEMQSVTLNGLTDQGVSRTLRLIPHADGTEVDLLETAVELLASQMRREIEGPRSLW
jgi:hypothetical protein